MRIEARADNPFSHVHEMLHFLVGDDNYYSMDEYSSDGTIETYSVHDDENKYFTRPPQTEYELRLDEERKQRKHNDDGLPF